jgi:C-terminal processing protease CtpA/Prc
MRQICRLIALFAILLLALPIFAQDDAIPEAEIVNDEGGTRIISGEVDYTNAFFTAGVSEPLIILEDQTGFVNRDLGFLFPRESQVLGQITSDFFTSPFTYTISLPIEPQGLLNDVDQDTEDDTGVMIFQVAYWTNTFGDGLLEERDQGGGGWSTAYASARISSDADTQREYIGGKLLIYAPDGQQAFPSGFGDDDLLFTEDDPLVTVPQGYTVVDMDTDPFTFDRSAHATIDLIEGEGVEADDFSDLSYTEAFDAMVEKMRTEYAFTENKSIDWDALVAEFRPRIAEAEANNDSTAYQFALRDFLWSIPDGHVAMTFSDVIVNQFFAETDGGIGIAIREVDGGRVIVNYVLEGSPAAETGIELGAEIVAIDGMPILDYVDSVQAWSAPFSTPHTERLQNLRYATRFEVGEEVEVTFINPGETEEQTVTLTAINERDSFNFSSFNAGTSGFELPVEYEPIQDNKYMLVEITSFFDDERLTVQLWERMITNAINNGVQGIIIDMRNNGGGSGFLATQMAAYFFQEELNLGNTGYYDEELDDFFFDTNTEEQFYLPPEELRYDGEVVVIVGPNCSSACEFFSYMMSLQDRATLIGHYPTGGLGGSVEQFFMPDDITIQFTIGRAVDAEGNIHIEGIGAVPDIVVPVTEEVLFSEDDALLDAAIAYLDEQTGLTITDGGVLEYESEVTGEIAAGERVQYQFTIQGGEPISLYLVAEGLDTVLNVYDQSGENLLTSNDDFAGTLNSALEDIEVGTDLTVLLEVATIDDAGEGSYTLMATNGEPPFQIVATDGGAIAVGDSVTGEFTAGERVAYTLELPAGETINIHLTGDMDTFLRVYDAEGNELESNDDFGDGTNSGVEGLTFDTDMTLTIEAATFGDSESGEYTLTVEPAE